MNSRAGRHVHWFLLKATATQLTTFCGISPDRLAQTETLCVEAANMASLNFYGDMILHAIVRTNEILDSIALL
jgi:hypothetical protein